MQTNAIAAMLLVISQIPVWNRSSPEMSVERSTKFSFVGQRHLALPLDLHIGKALLMVTTMPGTLADVSLLLIL